MPTRLVRMVMGPVLVWSSKREARRLVEGITYEPPTFVERHNWTEDVGDGTKFKVVTMSQRGFRPVVESIAASVALPEEAALTVIGD